MASDQERAVRIVAVLESAYPRAVTALSHRGAFQLLVAVVLSARTTDAQVNKVTPDLFRLYPTAQAMAQADPADLEKLVRHLGLFRVKARHLVEMSRELVRRYGGEVPGERAALESLPGVGHKTAGVVLGVFFGKPTLPVDTHVFRVIHRLGLSRAADPARVEEELCRIVPPESRMALHHRLIDHGRTVCLGRSPRCGDCRLARLCAYPAGNREGSGG
ncbi:MAG: endonuclease III [Peptococcaceae bacterium]|nr:endonuclease III [Peptococcaceae bacterium]